MADGQQYDTSQLDEVQHPTLGTLKFPKAMPPEERNGIIEGMEQKAGKPVASAEQSGRFAPGAIQTRKGGPVYASPAAASAARDEDRRAGIEAGEKAAASFVPGGELGIGAVKGALSTGRNIGHLLTKTPVLGKYLASADPNMATGEAPEALTPHGTAQKIGFGGEQAAEFLIPGAGEEKAGALGGRVLPRLGKAAPVLGRLGYNTLTTGAVNAAQGGDFGTGALLGGGFGALGEAGRAIAPQVAESALRITDRMRGRGRTIGQAVLDESKAIRPGPLAKETSSQIKNLTGQMEDAVHQATLQGVQGTTQPAHDVLNEAIANTPRNARSLRDKLQSLRDMLDLDEVKPGQARRLEHTPDELLEIKRGIDKEITAWPPEWQKSGDVQRVKEKLYGAIDGELDRLVSGNAQINQRISSLIPASRQARRLGEGAPLSQRLAGRMSAHTGALAPFIAGEALAGAPGGVAGLIAPEVLSSPAAQLLGARVLRSGVPQRLGRGAAAQLLGRGKQDSGE